MPSLERLSSEDRRELLAKLLQKKALDQSGAHPYCRHVNPYLAHSLSQLELDKRFVRGEGCYLYDSRGEQYLDFISQYGSVPFGYNPPEIWEALERLRSLGVPSFVQPSVLTVAGELAERLVRAAPPGLEYVTFGNSGAEAVEIAIKLCRSATGRPGILATSNSFHGKTLGALSATGRAVYQDPFMAPAEGFHHIPYGHAAALERALEEKKDYYGAFLIEPLQGEGGVIEPPAGYLKEVREICRRKGVLLVLDEVQTGLGRTGAMFACQREGVAPDLMTLAKALGGGLMPIAACLCTEAVYNEDFALTHSSTFAGNALAAQAGLATMDLLEADDALLVRQVAENGGRLKHHLQELQAKYPDVVEDVRGQGYFLGLQISLDAFPWQGLFAYAAQQHLDEMFGFLLTSYLLNTEKVRVAPTASAGDVLRIEPPLIAGWKECEILLGALERTLGVLERGNFARLFTHLIGSNGGPRTLPARPNGFRRAGFRQSQRRGQQAVPQERRETGRFAFLLHMNSTAEYTNLEPGLRALGEKQVLLLKKRFDDHMYPLPISEITIESKTGAKAYGEFILAPYTAGELVELPLERAQSKIAAAVEVGQSRGAQIVGLGGFASVVTQGGLSLNQPHRPPLTTGNSYTVASTKEVVDVACRQRGRELAECSVAVVGAGGSLGRATAMLFGESASRLILIGNPDHPQLSRTRLLEAAGSILHHLWTLQAAGRTFARGTVGSHLESLAPEVPPNATRTDFVALAKQFARQSGAITISTNVDRCLHEADVIVTATSSVQCFINSDNIKHNAIVCETSRPFNIGKDVKKARPDVLFIEGGKVRIPGSADLGFDLGYERGIALACMAETMLLALEQRFEDTSLGVELDLQTVHVFEALAEKHGFVVVT